MNIFKKIFVSVTKTLGKIEWKSKNILSSDEHTAIKELLAPNYYVILTRRNNHLSTYLVSLANFFLTRKLSYWSHVLMNVEDEVKTDDDYLLIEAIGSGVTTSHFDNVFNVNGVAILRPKNISLDQWTLILDAAKENLGKSYDNLFDLKSDKEMSCVELIRDALQADPEYNTNFAHFEEMIRKSNNLTPQMFYDCPDFVVVYEIRRK